MTELRWETATFARPRIHYLYRGATCFGMAYRENPQRFAVYQKTLIGTANHVHIRLCSVPTLEEAKQVLQTIAGSQS